MSYPKRYLWFNMYCFDLVWLQLLWCHMFHFLSKIWPKFPKFKFKTKLKSYQIRTKQIKIFLKITEDPCKKWHNKLTGITVIAYSMCFPVLLIGISWYANKLFLKCTASIGSRSLSQNITPMRLISWSTPHMWKENEGRAVKVLNILFLL